MKKYKLNYLLLSLLATGALFTSCNTDDATGDSAIIVNDVTGSVAALSSTPSILMNGVTHVNEGGLDKELTFTVTTNDVQPVDLYVHVTLVSGDAIEDEDFQFDHTVLIPTGSTSGVGTVTILGDSADEAMETFTLQVGNEFDANVSVNVTTMTFEVTDYGDLNLSFAWNRSFPGYPADFLDDYGYDVDVYIYDSSGNDLSDNQAATGASPEVMHLDLDVLADGSYDVYMQVYDDGSVNTFGLPTFDIPMTVSYTRDNTAFAGSFVQDAVDVINSDFGATAGYDTMEMYVCTITVSNNMYTFSKNGGSAIATGRMASHNVVRSSKSRSAVTKKFNK